MHKDTQHYSHSKLQMTSIFNNMELVKQKIVYITTEYSIDIKWNTVQIYLHDMSFITNFRLKRDTELPRQVYWSGLQFSSPGDLFDPGIEPGFPALQTDSLPSEPPGKPACLSMITSERVPPSQLFSIISSSFLLSNFHHL